LLQHPKLRLTGQSLVQLRVTNDQFCSDSFTQRVNGLQHFEFKVYPNPATEVLWVESPTEMSVDIYNNLGQWLQKANLQVGKNKIVLSDWAQGFYNLRYDGGVFPFLKY
jgi:hypothetical protein